MTEAELAQAARPILDALYAAELDSLRARFEEWQSKGRAATDLTDVARAATFGAVDTLFVDIDDLVEGTLDPDSGAITGDGRRRRGRDRPPRPRLRRPRPRGPPRRRPARQHRRRAAPLRGLGTHFSHFRGNSVLFRVMPRREYRGVPQPSRAGRELLASPPSPDAEMAASAARQHGVVTLAQLRAPGSTRTRCAVASRAGRLHRVHRGVYAVGHAGLSREGRWMAAVLGAGEDSALSHLSVARFWDVSRWRTAAHQRRLDEASQARRRRSAHRAPPRPARRADPERHPRDDRRAHVRRPHRRARPVPARVRDLPGRVLAHLQPARPPRPRWSARTGATTCTSSNARSSSMRAARPARAAPRRTRSAANRPTSRS